MGKRPSSKFNFLVEWGEIKIHFTEITGLEMSSPQTTLNDATGTEYNAKKIPGMQKLSNITMKRGISGSSRMLNADHIEKRDITITLLNERNEPVMKWEVKGAWPVKVQSSDLKADGNEVAIETLEIAHDGLKIYKD